MESTLRKRVLIADDFDNSAELLASFIESESNFEAVAVQDGRQALNQSLVMRPDACVLDIEMPHIGGIGVARVIRAAFVERRPLLIAMTGGSMIDALQSAMFDHVLPKPVDFGLLLRLLRTMDEPLPSAAR